MRKGFLAAALLLALLPALFTPFGTGRLTVETDAGQGGMAALSERMALRAPLTDLNDRLLSLLGASGSEQVVRGKNGFLFYAETLDGSCALTDEERTALTEKLTALRDELAAQGKTLVILIAPDKRTVYPEYLPAGYGASNALEETEEALAAAGLNTVNALDALQSAKGSDLLYFAGDTHWNARGAYAVYRRLAETLQAAGTVLADAFPELPETADGTAGDLIRLVRPGASRTEPDAEIRYTRTWKTARPMRSADDLKITATCQDGSGNVLVVRDSFGRALLDYLAQSTAKLIYSRSYEDIASQAEKAQADTVVLEIAERRLKNLLDPTTD